MTVRYVGNNQWELHFDDNKKIIYLSEHEIREIYEQADEILYGEEHHATKILEEHKQTN